MDEGQIQQLARTLLAQEPDTFSPGQRRVFEYVRGRRAVSRDLSQDLGAERKLGARLADRIAAFGGSWTFLIIFGLVLVAWVLLNSVVLARGRGSFDPYPYVFLNLMLSMLAAVQAPVILMAQNRQSEKDRIAAAHDYEVNLKAEIEIMALHEKLDRLRTEELGRLISRIESAIGKPEPTAR